jgi:hypothetical protein
MIGFLRLPQRLAGAGKTLRILANMALAHKRNRHGIIVGGGAGLVDHSAHSIFK